MTPDVAPSSPDGLHCGYSLIFRCCAASRSPRPLRTGSIAATSPPHGGRATSPGRPVLSGRAPLRPGRVVVDSATRVVAPSSPDGLHCGGTREWIQRLVDVSPRPLRTGSIAAGWPSYPVTWAMPGRPVLSGRAPLRRCVEPIVLQGNQVAPSSPDGLHCGFQREHDHGPRDLLSPRPLRTGSIAARRQDEPAGAATRRPVLSGRAPLRPQQTAHHRPSTRCRPVLSGRAPLRRIVGVK